MDHGAQGDDNRVGQGPEVRRFSSTGGDRGSKLSVSSA